MVAMSTETITVFHNPNCSKSRQAVDILTARGVEFRLYEYLSGRPSVDELRRVMAALGLTDPRGMMRTKEALYAELELADATAEELFAAMADHPKLIERPIVIRGDRAVIGRPPEQVETILD